MTPKRIVFITIAVIFGCVILTALFWVWGIGELTGVPLLVAILLVVVVVVGGAMWLMLRSCKNIVLGIIGAIVIMAIHGMLATSFAVNAAMGESLIQQYQIQDAILILRVDGDVWNSASEQDRDLAFQQIQRTWEMIRRDRVSSDAIAGIRIEDLAGNTLRQTGMFGQ